MKIGKKKDKNTWPLLYLDVTNHLTFLFSGKLNNGINDLFWSLGPQWKASGFEFGNASWEKMTLLTTGPWEPDPHTALCVEIGFYTENS